MSDLDDRTHALGTTPSGRRPPDVDEVMYAELRKIAVGLVQRRRGHTLQATDLVNEAYVRMAEAEAFEDRGRVKFLAGAANAMRWVLIDRARRRQNRPDSDLELEALDHVVVAYEDKAFDLLALDDEIARLERHDPAMAQAIVLIFFGGATNEEAARHIDLPLRTFEREWKATKALLLARMSHELR